MLYSNQGRYADAVALYEPAYRRAVDKYGLADNRTRRNLQMLSVGLPKVGRTADAVGLLEAALPELRETFGPANSAISPHVINLSHCYGLLGRHRKAVELLEATIAAVPEAERGTYVNYDFLLRNLKGSYAGLGELAQSRRVGAELLNRTRRRHPPGSLELANGLARVAVDDLGDRLYADAEAAAREALAIREARIPDGWPTFNNKTLVGAALLGQKKYAEAEPLLFTGYEGLKARRHLLPPPSAAQEDHLSRAGWQLALLYDRTGRPVKAAAVRAELPRETAPRPRVVKP